MACVLVTTCADALLAFSDLYFLKTVIGMRSGLTIVCTNSLFFPFLFFSIFTWPGASWVFLRLFMFLNKESKTFEACRFPFSNICKHACMHAMCLFLLLFFLVSVCVCTEYLINQ